MGQYSIYIIWLWRVFIIAALLASCYFSRKGDEHKVIICMLHAIVGATLPLAFYVLE